MILKPISQNVEVMRNFGLNRIRNQSLKSLEMTPPWEMVLTSY